MTIWTPDLSLFEGPSISSWSRPSSRPSLSGALPRDLAADPQGPGRPAGVTVGTVTRAYAEAERRSFAGGQGGAWHLGQGATDPANEWVIRNEDNHRIELWQNLPVQLDRGAIVRPLLTELAQGISTVCSATTRRRARLAAPAVRRLARRAGHRGQRGSPAVQPRRPARHPVGPAGHRLRGETLLCEGLSYPGMLGNARQLKNQVVGLAMDEEGCCPRRWRRPAAPTGPLLYLTPTLQNPTTATMSLARREAIIAIARRHDLLIVEDDVNGLLPESALPPWSTWRRSGSSTWAAWQDACGGLRVGFVLAPPALRNGFAQAMRLSSWMVSPLLIELACKLVSQRQIMPLIEQQRRILARRGSFAPPAAGRRWQPGSMHAWLPLPEPGAVRSSRRRPTP